jgi:hypothetical protein
MIMAAGLCAVLAASSACNDDEDSTPAATPPPASAAAPSATAEATAAPTSTAGADAAISIAVPEPAASVDVPILASGTANTFEAALTVDVIADDGGVLCRRNIMATSGSGTPGTWQTTIAIPPPDVPTAATFRAYELSAQDGSEVNVVERPIMISAKHPALYITSPACLATIPAGAPLTVNGRGLVFEAVFILQLRDASGAAVAEQRAMAGGTEELGFATTIAIPAELASGLYDLVAFNYSARDGAIENEFSVQVIVQP